MYYCFNQELEENETFLDVTGHSYSNRLYYLVSQSHVHGGGSVARVREYSLVSASPPQGQESGLISARHQSSLSLHTHSGREVRLGSRSKPVNLIQMWDVTVMCWRQTWNPLQARLEVLGRKTFLQWKSFRSCQTVIYQIKVESRHLWSTQLCLRRAFKMVSNHFIRN